MFLIRHIQLIFVLLLFFVVYAKGNLLAQNIDYSDYEYEYNEYIDNQNVQILDDMEAFNRKVYQVNRSFDNIIGIPIIKTYRNAIPKHFKIMLQNSLNNFQEPANVINFLLDGDIAMAINSFWRLIINSTIGIFGIFDVATEFGLQQKTKTFEDFLYTKIKSDTYLYVPILGPTTIAGYIGLLFDFIVNPLTYIVPSYIYRTAFFLYIIQLKSEILGIYENTEKQAIDPYAAWKSYYIQYKNNKK